MAYLDQVQDCTEDPQPERRGAKRLDVLIPGRLSTMDGDYDCAVEDISQTGARIVTDADLRVGAECVLTCSPIDNLCSIVWTEGREAGLEFIDEITLGTVRLLRWNNDRFRGQHEAELRKIVRGWTENPD